MYKVIIGLLIGVILGVGLSILAPKFEVIPVLKDFVTVEVNDNTSDIENFNYKGVTYTNMDKINEKFDFNNLEFKIIPLEGTDSIKFGMTRDEIKNIFKKTPTLFKVSEVDLLDSEDYEFCEVHYETNEDNKDICCSIDFSSSSKFYIDDILISEDNIEKTKDLFINQEDYKILENEFSTRITSKANEIYIIFDNNNYFETIEHAKQSVRLGISRKGYKKERIDFLEKNLTPENIEKVRGKYIPLLEKVIDENREVLTKEHKFIQLKPYGKYYGDNPNEQNIDNLDIPIGSSRIGGPVVDLPEDIEYPDGFYFVAQLNCKTLKKNDFLNALPHTGYIYFFTNESLDNCIVKYTSKDSTELKRVTKFHQNSYFQGKLIGKFFNKTESLKERLYIEELGEIVWNPFYGDDITKIYGLYSNQQKEQFETIDIVNEFEELNQVILLQIGSDFSYGVHSFYIGLDELKSLDFSKVESEYSCD